VLSGVMEYQVHSRFKDRWQNQVERTKFIRSPMISTFKKNIGQKRPSSKNEQEKKEKATAV
jgi:hypothetical protein